jgi:hypothetical protein
MKLSFSERYRQARLYAAQVRRRQEMGKKYAHYQSRQQEQKR